MSIAGGLLIAFGAAGTEWVGPVLDRAAECLFDGAGKRALEEIQARLRAYTGNVPINHDLEQAIRLAELTSTLMFWRRFGVRTKPAIAMRAYRQPLFIDAPRKWLHEHIGLSPRMRVVPNDKLVTEIVTASRWQP